MKTVPSEFTKLGFRHKLIERTGNAAIFERQHRNHSRPHWEVVKIRVAKANERFGKSFEESEVYPSSEQWGIYGWTATTLDDARSRAEKLLKIAP